MDKKLLTIDETCELLNIKHSRIRVAIYRREIPFIKVGALIRFDMDDLDRWIEEQKVRNEQ